MKEAFQLGTRELGKTYSSYLDLPAYGHMYTIFQAARIMRLAIAAHRQAFVLHQLVSRGNPLFLVYPLAMPSTVFPNHHRLQKYLPASTFAPHESRLASATISLF